MLLMKNPLDAVKTAMILAQQAHEGQLDKQGEPYIWHVYRVGLNGKTIQEKIVGLLHDTIEDSTILELESILNFFGPEIADAVEAITRRSDESYEDFIQRVKANPLATQVKILDLKDNLSRIFGLPKEDQDRLEPRYRQALTVLTLV